MSVTLLFTDIEGSTRLAQELGGAYPAALEEHRRIVRDALAAAGGETRSRPRARSRAATKAPCACVSASIPASRCE